MKLFIKGKMFESLDTMAVTGENDEELYYLKKDTSSAGHVVTLSGADGGKIADIEQRGNGGKASFAVIMNGTETAVAVVMAIRMALYRASVAGSASTTAVMGH